MYAPALTAPYVERVGTSDPAFGVVKTWFPALTAFERTTAICNAMANHDFAMRPATAH